MHARGGVGVFTGNGSLFNATVEVEGQPQCHLSRAAMSHNVVVKVVVRKVRAFSFCAKAKPVCGPAPAPARARAARAACRRK